MGIEIINSYITARYERWLDYSKYHCSLACMSDEATDVLNEVLAMLLEKDPAFLVRMYKAKKNRFRELDFFILQMIKLNATSATSPYRHKYKPIPADRNVDWHRLHIMDQTEPEQDKAGVILQKIEQVRFVFDRLELTDLERRVFDFKFFAGMSFANWPGNENKKCLYRVYKVVLSAICELLYALGKTEKFPDIRLPTNAARNRADEICNKFAKKWKEALRSQVLTV